MRKLESSVSLYYKILEEKREYYVFMCYHHYYFIIILLFLNISVQARSKGTLTQYYLKPKYHVWQHYL